MIFNMSTVFLKYWRMTGLLASDKVEISSHLSCSHVEMIIIVITILFNVLRFVNFIIWFNIQIVIAKEDAYLVNHPELRWCEKIVSSSWLFPWCQKKILNASSLFNSAMYPWSKCLLLLLFLIIYLLLLLLLMLMIMKMIMYI